MEAGWSLPPETEPMLGEGAGRARARYVYQLTWEVLRRRGGWRRPLRLQPVPGMTMLLSFGRDGLAALPQRPPAGVPARLRGLALVGRSLAAHSAGTRLLVVTALRSASLEGLLRRGHVALCTLDRLEEMLCRLER
jgi:hypothetical protein